VVDDVCHHLFACPAVGCVDVIAHGKIRAGVVGRREAGEVHAVRVGGPEEGGFAPAGVAAHAFVVVETGVFRADAHEGVDSCGDVRLEDFQDDRDVQVVRAGVAREEDGDVETQGVCGPDVIADVFEIDPRGHGGEPRACFADFLVGPGGVEAGFVTVPVLGWGDDASKCLGGAAEGGVGPEGVHSDCVLGAVRFTQAVGQVGDGAGFKCGF